MADRLPVRPYNFDAAALAERAQIPAKLDQYLNPGKYGVSWGPRSEAALFLAAADRGFIPKDGEGMETLFAWRAVGSAERLQAGLFAFVAFLAHFDGVPLATIATATEVYPGLGPALELEYGEPLPPKRPALAAPTSPARTLVTQPNFVVTKSTAPARPGFPAASGDGIHFPMIAWRLRTLATGGGLPAEFSYSPWIRYPGIVINRTSSADVAVEFFEDLTGAEQEAVVNAQSGGPPPLNLVDVIAAPNSTSVTPVTLPAGSASIGTRAPIIPPAVPSGSIPVPDAAAPGVKPWTDAAPPPDPYVGGAPAVAPPASVGSTSTGAAAAPAPMFPSWLLWAGLAAVALVYLTRKGGK